jgi:uncharacterized protein (TIGR02145 family)
MRQGQIFFAVLLLSAVLNAQNVEVLGGLKIVVMDTIAEGETVVVRRDDGTLAERSNALRVSQTGDTLFIGSNWVIVPDISMANYMPPSVDDVDSNSYATVVIGAQQWFVENLRTTKYNDGTPIPLVTTNGVWDTLTSPAYCWYDNDSTSNAMPYGALYNYYTVADTSSKNVCPIGWHVPSDSSWTVLINTLGGSTVAGGKMKEVGTEHWTPPNNGATNSSGFTAVAGGNRNTSGVFDEFGNGAFFWSSSVHSVERSWYRFILNNAADVYRENNLKDIGFSIRCLKD